MLYIDEVTLHNFKSFRNASIKLSQGFNCIVGPNGSGKSNVCDALLFALGEMSAKRMRIQKANDLISDFLKAADDDGYKKGAVRVKFSGDHEIEIQRAVRSDRKVSYRLNGKRVTRQDVIYALREVNGDMSEINTIAQGEINRYLNLSAKERRGLIDIAAGIREFNEKRDSAMRELDKVQTKLNEANIMLNERLGFLKDLEKEKEDALRYTQLTTQVKAINYTLLKTREEDVTRNYESSIKAFSERQEARKKIDSELSTLDSKIATISKERESKSKSLGARSAETASTNRLLEEANKNIAVGNTQITSLSDNEKKAKERIESLQKEMANMSEKIKAGNEQVKKTRFELEVKQKDLPEIDAESGAMADVQSLTKRYQEAIEGLETLDKEFAVAESSYSHLSSELSSLEKNEGEAIMQLKTLEDRKAEILSEVKSKKEELMKQEDLKRTAEKLLKDWDVQLAGVKKSLSALDEEHIELRQQLAMSGRESDKAYDLLKKGVGEGIYGRAYELCSYDDRYAMAVQAAAGARLNYFVVDTIETADAAISLLKQYRAGRATFIPLDSIVTKDQKGPKNLRPLLDAIRYDKKFANAFAYVFANTYLTIDLNEAKKSGFGQYRYVTMEGELVEASGVVSGGSMGKIQTPAMIEAKIKRVEEERKKQFATQESVIATMDSHRKSIAKCETEAVRLNTEIKGNLQLENELNKDVKSSTERATALTQRILDTKRALAKIEEERKRIEETRKPAKEDAEKAKTLLDKLLSGKQTKATKEETAKIKAQREEVERLKIAIAELAKEGDFLGQREKELKAEIKAEKESLAKIKDQISEISTGIENAETQKKELEETMKSHGKKTSEMFSAVQALEEEIAQLSAERGKRTGELERINRDMMEQESKKAQLQTRLTDIKAELSTYQDGQLLKGKLEDLERELIIAKNDIEKMGAVNMRAPEMYDLKKKDADEAQQKMSTLDTERNSIVSMIEEIETKKMNIFMETLEAINKNFGKLYSHIFDGNAALSLDEPKDPFNSGLSITLTMNGNKKQSEQRLSGGQKSLIALALLFAIQLRKPMSYYIFDEIDSALDKENSKKLSIMIKEMSKRSQFIVVSHNDTMIVAADTAIGVVKKDVKKSNEAQIVGIQLTGKDGSVVYGKQEPK